MTNTNSLMMKIGYVPDLQGETWGNKKKADNDFENQKALTNKYSNFQSIHAYVTIP